MPHAWALQREGLLAPAGRTRPQMTSGEPGGVGRGLGADHSPHTRRHKGSQRPSILPPHSGCALKCPAPTTQPRGGQQGHHRGPAFPELQPGHRCSGLRLADAPSTAGAGGVPVEPRRGQSLTGKQTLNWFTRRPGPGPNGHGDGSHLPPQEPAVSFKGVDGVSAPDVGTLGSKLFRLNRVGTPAVPRCVKIQGLHGAPGTHMRLGLES